MTRGRHLASRSASNTAASKGRNSSVGSVHTISPCPRSFGITSVWWHWAASLHKGSSPSGGRVGLGERHSPLLCPNCPISSPRSREEALQRGRCGSPRSEHHRELHSGTALSLLPVTACTVTNPTAVSQPTHPPYSAICTEIRPYHATMGQPYLVGFCPPPPHLQSRWERGRGRG